jgi:hypothetical protein
MKPWLNDPFFQHPLVSFNTSAGTIDLPILYFDCSNFQLLYEVPYQAAAALLADQPVTAARLAGNKALAAVAVYEYRDTAVGSYNEVGVAIATLPEGTAQPASPWLALYQPLDKRMLGMTIIDLPVTTAAANAAGREVWGYPKFVTPIQFGLTGRQLRCQVEDPDGKHTIMTVDGTAGLGIPGPQLDLVLYSTHHDKLLRTTVVTRGGGQMRLPGSLQLRVGDSKHPMASRLQQLGLDRIKPKFAFASHRLQLRLNAGTAIATTAKMAAQTATQKATKAATKNAAEKAHRESA